MSVSRDTARLMKGKVIVSRWRSIWENRTVANLNLNKSEFEIFCDLKKADGFDVSVGSEDDYYRIFYDTWKEMYQNIINFAGGIRSVYEVGCGSGVNLFLFQNRVEEKALLGGIDYSASLVDIAKRIVSSDDLICGEAKDMDETRKYDLVMSDSVFQYFEGIDYAEKVLRKMITKADKLVYIGEIHDSSLKEEWLGKRRKSLKHYDEIYEGLPKNFYSRDWINHIARDYNRKTYFTEVDNKEYWNSRYLFNCYIY